MFKLFQFADSAVAMAILAFFFTAGIFIYTTVRALKLPKERREKLANLPLDDSHPINPKKSNHVL